jgi:hypothetical protein
MLLPLRKGDTETILVLKNKRNDSCPRPHVMEKDLQLVVAQDRG